jgi:hypothetical protein
MPYITEVLPNRGLNTNAPEEYLAEGTAPNLFNVQLQKSCIAKRDGAIGLPDIWTNPDNPDEQIEQTPIAGSDKYILAIFNLVRDGVQHTLRVGVNKVELFVQGEPAYWVDITGGTLNVQEHDDLVSGVIAFDNNSEGQEHEAGLPTLVFTNFIDPIKKYEGTGNISNLGGEPPKARFVCAFGAYLFLGWIDDGRNVYRSQIRWCNTGDFEEWVNGNAGGTMLVDEQNDEGITGMALFGNYLCIHKATSIWLGSLLANTNVISFERKPNVIGTVCANTIQNLPDGNQIYLSKDGIMLFNGINSALIPAPIQDELRNSMNPKFIQRCWSALVTERDEYWVGVPISDSQYPDTIYKYNYILGTVYKDMRRWQKPDTENPSEMIAQSITAAGRMTRDRNIIIDAMKAPIEDVRGRFDDNVLLELSKPIVFGSATGFTMATSPFAVNDFVDNVEKPIESLFETKDYQTEAGRVTRWRKLEIWARGNTISVQHSFDKGYSWSAKKKIVLGREFPSFDSPQKYWFDGVGDTVRFRFTNDEFGEQWALKQFRIEYSVRELQ